MVIGSFGALTCTVGVQAVATNSRHEQISIRMDIPLVDLAI
jgi:hypothetical protein